MMINKQSIINPPPILNPALFLDQLDIIRVEVQKSLNKQHQSEMGQFFTPPSVTKMMAGMFTHFQPSINLIDPGAGVGSLSAAFISKAVQASPRPEYIKITAYELDGLLVSGLERTLLACQQLCDHFKINFYFDIRQEDFIASSVETLLGNNSLFSTDQPNYNYAILNPPYKKINSSSRTRHLLTSVGIETTNMYSGFMWLVMKLLVPDSEMVAIIPRSFCNGTYFRPFRSELLQTMAIERIHIFDSRDKAFKAGDVLQENIIVHALKPQNSLQKITITSSNDPGDDHLVTRVLDYNQVVQQNDPDLFIRIVPDQLGHQISAQVNSLTSTLQELGITVSTGRVVDFRSRDFLRDKQDKEIIPLIYPENLQTGYVSWPRSNTKKPSYLACSKEVDGLVIPSEYYVFVKRFSSKEEKRRVYAALYDPHHFQAKKVGVENHINYFYRRYGSLSEDLAKGLTLYLNSSLVDQFFRQFSGHTQVNATDLRNLKYPSETQLLALGRRISEQFPDQDGIDKIVNEELALNDKDNETGITILSLQRRRSKKL
jgi:adenine-specific DNA-methyltransferase